LKNSVTYFAEDSSTSLKGFKELIDDPDTLVKEAKNYVKKSEKQYRFNEIKENGLIGERRMHELDTWKANGTDFMGALPNPGLGMTMSSNMMLYAIRHALGVRLYVTDSECKICGNFNNDVLGIHAQTCKHGLTYRHDVVKGILGTICRESGHAVEVEKKNIFTGTQEKPGDLVLDQNTCIDVTIIEGSIRTCPIEEAMDKAAENKHKKYSERCLEVNYNFKAFVMNTVGGFHKEALDLIKSLANKWGPTRGQDIKVAERQIKQRLSFALKKAQAYQFMIRDVEVDDFEDTFLEL
jgi:hypothetical protein